MSTNLSITSEVQLPEFADVIIIGKQIHYE